MFDTMKRSGFEGIIGQVATDQGASPETVTEARKLLGQFTHNIHSAVDQFIRGQPGDVEEIAAPIDRMAAALRLLADAAEAASTAIRENPGTVAFHPNRLDGPTGGRTRRTWG